MNQYLIAPIKLFFALTSQLMPSLATRVAEKLFTTVPYSKRRENEKELLETADRFIIEMESGHKLAAYRWGEKTDPTILFVHGWTATATCFARFIDHLVGRGYQVISYDSIAHGDSSGRSVALPEWADSVAAVNSHIGHVHCIVGHSLGAAAIVLASSVSLDTDRVVLLSPATNVNDVVDQFASALHIPPGIIVRMRDYMWEKYHASVSKYGRNWRDVFVSDFKIPTLIVHDKNDKEVDIDNAKWLARQWPWAELVETERLGHRRILLSQKVISMVGEFIQKPAAEVRV